MRLTFSLFLILPGLFYLVLSSCSTPAHIAFEKIQIGHEKNDVLELLGSPNKTRRWNGQDQWTYIFYKNDKSTLKEIKFEQGRVIAVQNDNGQNSVEYKIRKARNLKEYEQIVRPSGKQEAGFQELNGPEDDSQNQANE